MNQQSDQKHVKVKKSSIQLDQSSLLDQQQSEDPKIESVISQNAQKDDTEAEIDNLLDLDTQKNDFDIQGYKQFLKDRIVIIQGPELITENVVKSYKLYKIKSRKKSAEAYDTCVSRRFSDYQYLQKKLIEEYGGCIIPLLPEKNFWANINMQGEQFVSERTKNLEKYLKNLLNHERIKLAPELRNFLFFDEIKFSEGKGDFFSRIKTEDKVKAMASNAYNFGWGIYSKYFQGKEMAREQIPKINKPTLEDLKLMQYQRDVQGLVKVIKVLQQMVQNSVEQMRIIQQLESNYYHKQIEEQSLPINHQQLKFSFQELSQYILSCHDALNRRNSVRIQIDQLTYELEGFQKKIKTNPRSQEVDVTRNKLAKAQQKCEKWTNSLLYQLEKSVAIGKSMVQNFIDNYTDEKQKFYHS